MTTQNILDDLNHCTNRGQLIKDRKTLTQQLNDYKRKMRETASEQE